MKDPDILRSINNQSLKGYKLETCFGIKGCPNRVTESKELVEKIKVLLESKHLKEFLEKKLKNKLRIHHQFSISLSDCPNACSRPQIVDIGIIGTSYPEISDSTCKTCGNCVDTCEEDAIQLLESPPLPIIDPEKCLGCGQCVKNCPTKTLIQGQTGYRILIGGKLGRHPQLGYELKGLFSEQKLLFTIEKILDFYIQKNKKGERLGEILNKIGINQLLSLL